MNLHGFTQLVIKQRQCGNFSISNVEMVPSEDLEDEGFRLLAIVWCLICKMSKGHLSPIRGRMRDFETSRTQENNY